MFILVGAWNILDNHAELIKKGFPTKCIFCEGDDPLTEEDYWPKWMRRYMPSPYNSSSHATSAWFTVDGSFVELRKGLTKHKNRGPLSLPLKVVCAACNNGWMSRLQKVTGPYLKPLMEGTWQGLNEHSQRNLAAWAVMFSMVLDFKDMQTQNISQSERTTLKEFEVPPANWIISIGFLKHTGFHGSAKKRSIGTYRLNDSDVPYNYPVQFTILAAGKLVILTYSTLNNFSSITPPAIESGFGLKVIWPAVSWPIRPPYRKISTVRLQHIIDSVTTLATKDIILK